MSVESMSQGQKVRKIPGKSNDTIHIEKAITESSDAKKDELPIDANNLAAFAGTPNSIAEGIDVTFLDTSNIDAELTRGDELDRRAKEIYYAGEALEFLRKACAKLHAGDGNIITALFLSAGLVFVENSNGLDICITGQAGTGKSHVVDTVKKHLPQGRVFDSRFSPKALLYHQDKIKEGQIIHMDDQSMDDSFEEVYKGQSTNWSESYKYITVGKDNKPAELTLPPKLSFWITKMDGVGDEQTKSRQLQFQTSDSKAQLEQIRKAQNAMLKNPRITLDTTDQEIAQRIWNHVPHAYVIVPFADDIKNNDTTDTRNYNMMCELMKASAILSAPLRNRSPEGDIEASVKDFELAARIMNPLLSNHGGSQKHKLSPDATRILSVLAPLDTGYYTLGELQGLSGLSYEQVRRGISGRDTKDHGGLKDRCPALTVNSISHPVSGGNTCESSIFWDKAKYEKWCVVTGGLFCMDESRIAFWETNEESKRNRIMNLQR